MSFTNDGIRSEPEMLAEDPIIQEMAAEMRAAIEAGARSGPRGTSCSWLSGSTSGEEASRPKRSEAPERPSGCSWRRTDEPREEAAEGAENGAKDRVVWIEDRLTRHA